MEYILKHFVHLREHPERPDCLTPIESFTDESFGVVTQLIDDVFNICPLAPAIHLGGDEVGHYIYITIFTSMSVLPFTLQTKVVTFAIVMVPLTFWSLAGCPIGVTFET